MTASLPPHQKSLKCAVTNAACAHHCVASAFLDIPGTACQACGHGLAFCRPSELSLPATRALFKQGHKLSTACSLVSVFPW
eukprot:scaffold106966_cov22-Tisochrysis_lutea.AAC.1